MALLEKRIFRSRRIVTPGGVVDGAVEIHGERIARVISSSELPASWPEGVQAVELGEKVLLPGIVDCHAHVNEPGRTEWEGFETATRAAAAGGITTVVDMPLNCIPATTTLDALRVKSEVAASRCAVDYAFWGGVVPGNAGELEPMVEAGAVGFKAFLIESGVDEFPMSTRADLDVAMPILAKAGVPLLVHAELDLGAPNEPGDPRRYATYLASRPREWENAAIRMMIELCRRHRCAVHVVHLSSADALDSIARAKAEGLPLTVETCPHYLTFAAEEIPDGKTAYKCAPPIREAENRERLWEAVKDGRIDLVVSDHSPCTPALKKLEAGDFQAAWGGIASLQLSLSAVWSGMRAHGLGLEDLARLMARRPAELTGLRHRKGAIAEGQDADLVIFDPEASFTVEASAIRHRHGLTPYLGRTLFGKVEQTWLRGSPVDVTAAPRGERIRHAK